MFVTLAVIAKEVFSAGVATLDLTVEIAGGTFVKSATFCQKETRPSTSVAMPGIANDPLATFVVMDAWYCTFVKNLLVSAVTAVSIKAIN